MGKSVLIFLSFFRIRCCTSLKDVLIVFCLFFFFFSIHAVFYFQKILVGIFCYCHYFYERSKSENTEKNPLRSTETRPKFSRRGRRS